MTLLEIFLGTGFLGLLTKELIAWIFNRRKKRAEAQASEAAANASEIENEGSEIDNAFKAAKMWRENAEAFQEQFYQVQQNYGKIQKDYSDSLSLIQKLTAKIDALTKITEDQTKEILKLETKVQTLTRENRKFHAKLAQ